MVNEHLRCRIPLVETPPFVSDGNTTDRERQRERERERERRGQKGKHTKRGGKQETGRKRRSRPVKDGGLILYFEISHTVFFTPFLSPWSFCMHLTGWKNWRGSFMSWHCSY